MVMSALFSFIGCSTDFSDSFILNYKQVDTCNALKGFVSWEGSANNDIPVSVTYVPVHLNDVLIGTNSYDFTVLENKLNAMKNKGLQSIVRFVPEEPGHDYTPDFIYEMGVEKISYEYGVNTYQTPNYKNQIFIDILENFIYAFAEAYDGDERIACVQAGFIGHWGEWHVYYCKDAMATMEQQKQILDAFAEGFKTTSISVRIPTAGGAKENANIGIFNDMFYSDGDDNYMRELFDESGIWDRWQTTMTTGEFAPPCQIDFLNNLNEENLAKYYDRLDEFHNSSLLMSELFGMNQSTINNIGKKKLMTVSNAMGYDFFIKSASVKRDKENLSLTVSIENKGVASFYYNWPVHVALYNGESIVKEFTSDWNISTIASKTTKNFTYHFPSGTETASGYSILIYIPNPMENGCPLRFSNATQDNDVDGYVTVYKF